MTEPVQRQQIGYDLAGNPMYAAPVQYAPAPAAQPLAPIVARPWGAYIAGGCLALVAFAIAAVVVALVVFGFAILSAVLALVAVALTICVVVLRSMWRDYQRGN
ncbi:hypothetical protein ACFVGN_05660 [Streptomyces sp. NPDC057757]|uniref:hypothetical protein n=1 Tax=Streptomyces sp. NPDC057757 TaxID=3346241 RepID=UPI0036D04960